MAKGELGVIIFLACFWSLAVVSVIRSVRLFGKIKKGGGFPQYNDLD